MTRAIDIAQVSYEAPDLALMERFLTDFGLSRIAHEKDALYMRGAGRQHHLHVTRRAAQARFVGASFEMSDEADLDALAALPGSSPVMESDEPGGGLVVRMTMPDGFEIRAVYGRAGAEPMPVKAPNHFNDGVFKRRIGSTVRTQRAPCQALRLGHVVLHVSDHDASVRWLQQRFDLLPSDHFLPPGQDGPVIGTFLRFNRGADCVDHHCMLVLQSNKVGVHHCSFEVQDVDAVMGAHDFLTAQGYQLDCGVGRHLLGSQIFDYWKDPFGFRVEHYTDGDVVDASHRPGTFNGTACETTQWGMEPPPEFFE
ncbi:VOC family protein [Paraburkholderia sp. LEh10]|uniref:VOC family protein n=1 Tax=Paraburkholderia sp. LEh10 TaxID=2821353 RepID=UPI001AE838EB|nr:VOC family protein [Paraburkholderia sp. LEh10]MBP0589972.1 VOC family protein [Paraburkholderia sp. LEh10]